MMKEKVNVKVVDSCGECLKEYTVEVDSRIIASVNMVYNCSNTAKYQHTASVFRNDWSQMHENLTNKELFTADRHVDLAIAGGVVADMILGKSFEEIKDIDVLYCKSPNHKIEEFYDYGDTYGIEEYYFNYEGIHYPLTNFFGFLSMPYCYGSLAGEFQVYKTTRKIEAIGKGIDFLFADRHIPDFSVLDTVVTTFDQDIKFGIYRPEEGFTIHEEMYRAIKAKKVSFNPRLFEPSEKEVERLKKANLKYFNRTVGMAEITKDIEDSFAFGAGLSTEEEVLSIPCVDVS